MNDLKMGFRHTMLQRLQNYSATPAKMSPTSPTVKVTENVQTPTTTPATSVTGVTGVTDFSINRILGDKGEKSNVNFNTNMPQIIKPTPVNVSSADILDLSKNAPVQEPTNALPAFQNLNYEHLFQPEFLAATKFYAHIFPHVFPAAYAAATATHLAATSAPTVFQKRFFAPHIINTGNPSSKTASIRDKSTATSNFIAPQANASNCKQLDCTGCLDYYKQQYSTYKSLPSPVVIDPYLSSHLSNIKPSNSSLLLNSAAKISLTTTTNVNITASKSFEIDNALEAKSRTSPTASLSEEISYKCRICDKVFGCSQTLQAHEKTHKSPRYECTDCGKGFSQLRNYKYHLSVHRGTKEFAAECPECGKTFNDKGYLSSHMKIHRNKKEYECPYCPKSFNQRVAFNMHVRIHTGVKPHKCVECGKRFSRKMLLKQHMRTHSGEKPYQCSVCGKSFADRSNMTLHHRLHSGIKPFNCPICPKAFTKKHHLKTHLNYHTGCKPYVCPHLNCNQAFTQSSNMRTHAKKCQYRPLQMSTHPLNSPMQQSNNLATVNTTSSNVNLLASRFVPISGLVASSTAATHHTPFTSTLTAGIRMLPANTIGASSIASTAVTSSMASIKPSTLSFPPTQQPLLSTMRPF